MKRNCRLFSENARTLIKASERVVTMVLSSPRKFGIIVSACGDPWIAFYAKWRSSIDAFALFLQILLNQLLRGPDWIEEIIIYQHFSFSENGWYIKRRIMTRNFWRAQLKVRYPRWIETESSSARFFTSYEEIQDRKRKQEIFSKTLNGLLGWCSDCWYFPRTRIANNNRWQQIEWISLFSS